MALVLEDKKAIVAEVANIAKTAISGLVADYRGLTVGQITKLRSDARAKGVYVKVVRNTLAKRALDHTTFACLHEVLTGPTLLAFSVEEPSAPARLFKDYVKAHELLSVKALVISGKLIEAAKLDYVAKLPTRNEALATLMQVIKAPITKFVRTLAEPHGKLVRTVAAIRDKKQAEV
jgi:large subunit ribosomal protein L10